MDKLRIPRIALPCVALPGHKPDAMLSAIRSSLVCWYSPKRQGCTNENMAQTPVLRDLSGRGLHMICHNFAWTTESGIAEDGSMIFDGVDDSCIIESAFVEQSFKDNFTIISDLHALARPTSWSHSAPISNGHPDGHGAFVFEQFRTTRAMCNWVYLADNEFSPIDEYLTSGRRTDCLTSETFNGQPVIRGDQTSSSSYLQFGTEFPNQRFWNGKIYSAIFFNRVLTPEEIEWVKLNMID